MLSLCCRLICCRDSGSLITLSVNDWLSVCSSTSQIVGWRGDVSRGEEGGGVGCERLPVDYND